MFLRYEKSSGIGNDIYDTHAYVKVKTLPDFNLAQFKIIFFRFRRLPAQLFLDPPWKFCSDNLHLQTFTMDHLQIMFESDINFKA